MEIVNKEVAKVSEFKKILDFEASVWINRNMVDVPNFALINFYFV